jgi:predicted nucleic acid-binding protein
MPRVTFDSSVFISRKAALPKSGFLLSAVVVQEMTAGAADKTDLRFWEAAFQAYEKEGKLLVPTGEDWYLAGKALNSLLRGLKSQARGKTPKLHPDDKQRIIRDVLIARTARRAGATVVTDNVTDFRRISRFCRVSLISGDEYFAGEW